MSEVRPPEEILWSLMRGALAARALGVVADLGIAKALASGARPVVELARESNTDADTLHRYLRALASDGVFAETEPGVFANTPASELLLRDAWDDFAHLFGGVFHRAAAELDISGEPTFTRLFGHDFWTWLAVNPSERASFDRAMGGGKERKVARLASVEWRDGETVVDVGGGNGTLLVETLRDRPEVHGIVFDLPETDRDQSAFPDHVEFVEGSFFERVPPGDTYVLSAILHDWSDEQASAILQTIRAAAPPGARVVINDAVIEPGNDPSGSKWLDLLMLALLKGRERDERQWRELLEGAGLEVVDVEDGLIQAECR